MEGNGALGNQKNEWRMVERGIKYFPWDIWGSSILNTDPKLAQGRLGKIGRGGFDGDKGWV